MNGMKTATMVIYMTEVEEVCYTEARAMQTLNFPEDYILHTRISPDLYLGILS